MSLLADTAAPAAAAGTAAPELLWYVPNQVEPGHRGDAVRTDHNSLDTLTEQALALERHGWTGALLGTGWGRPDTLTVATALAARTTTFEPLVAARPGYWRPAHFASATATLDALTGGRVRINIVSGQDDLAAYGDSEGDQAARYERTAEFIALVRRLWTEEAVTHEGAYFRVRESTVRPRIEPRPGRPHPLLYFGGASAPAERTSAVQADVQLFWGEPLDAIAERISRLRELSDALGRRLDPLQFGLRITTVVRESSDEAWTYAERKVAGMAEQQAQRPVRRPGWGHGGSVGQNRLRELAERGDVLDTNLYTAPATAGGGGAGSTWLVGDPAEVAAALRRYGELGITHFILSDTPYLTEIARQGELLLPLLRTRTTHPIPAPTTEGAPR